MRRTELPNSSDMFARGKTKFSPRILLIVCFIADMPLGFASLLLGKIVKMLCISGTELNSKSIRGENSRY